METSPWKQLGLESTHLREYASVEHLHYQVAPVQVEALQDHELEVEEDIREERFEVVQRHDQGAVQNPVKKQAGNLTMVKSLVNFQQVSTFFFPNIHQYVISNGVHKILCRKKKGQYYHLFTIGRPSKSAACLWREK